MMFLFIRTASDKNRTITGYMVRGLYRTSGQRILMKDRIAPALAAPTPNIDHCTECAKNPVYLEAL